ncbi:MAG: YbaK/EbsC family protein [Ignavibacteria bacterium]
MPDPFKKIRILAEQKGLLFEHHPEAYNSDVVTCEEAAKARNVNVTNELKHMLVKFHNKFALVHVCGNLDVELELVAHAIKVQQVHLASLKYTPIGHIPRGTICPFKQPLWSWFHILDKSIELKEWMTTNDGTKRGFLRFNPLLLRYSSNYMYANVSQPHSKRSL